LNSSEGLLGCWEEKKKKQNEFRKEPLVAVFVVKYEKGQEGEPGMLPEQKCSQHSRGAIKLKQWR